MRILILLYICFIWTLATALVRLFNFKSTKSREYNVHKSEYSTKQFERILAFYNTDPITTGFIFGFVLILSPPIFLFLFMLFQMAFDFSN